MQSKKHQNSIMTKKRKQIIQVPFGLFKGQDVYEVPLEFIKLVSTIDLSMFPQFKSAVLEICNRKNFENELEIEKNSKAV